MSAVIEFNNANGYAWPNVAAMEMAHKFAETFAKHQNAELLEALEGAAVGFGRCMKASGCGQEFIDIKMQPLLAVIRKARGVA